MGFSNMSFYFKNYELLVNSNSKSTKKAEKRKSPFSFLYVLSTLVFLIKPQIPIKPQYPIRVLFWFKFGFNLVLGKCFGSHILLSLQPVIETVIEQNGQ